MKRRPHIPNPVTLLSDDMGIYGVGLSEEYLAASDVPALPLPHEEESRIVLRPDRIGDVHVRGQSILQKLPPQWRRKKLFGASLEASLCDAMFTVMRHCAGIGDDDENFQIGKQQRRLYFGLEAKATRILNSLMGQALTVAEPEALRVARRFPPGMRWPIYSTGATSLRLRQLAETFPLLAWFIAPPVGNQTARDLVERGARLREVAAAIELPMQLRRIKPGAIHLANDSDECVLLKRPKLITHMPSSLPAMRR
jgi:hypothetical protein